MSRRILVTSTDLMMIQFLVPHVINLVENGYAVEIACSDVGGRMDEVREKLNTYVTAIHVVQLVRSPASLTNLKGYKEMKQVIESGHYDIIWTNEPVMGVVTRLAARNARKNGTKVIYMVHGFHFFKGASILNWLVFYPIEKFASKFCDEIVTINKEDYHRALKKMHASSVKYIHGIGINTDRLHNKDNQSDIRKELHLKEDDIILLSIGELSKRKNHQIVIKALGEIHDERIHYLICGKGILLDELSKLSDNLGIKQNVHFLGYRTDVVDICSQADIFILPSLQEGLSIASLEAMYCGLPVIISDIRGVRDYLIHKKNGFICKVDDVRAFIKAINTLVNNESMRTRIGKINRRDVNPYCLDEVKQEVMDLFA